MVVGHQSLIRTIETLSFKALPALERRYYDGWLLRYADGYTRRANSVNPVYASHEDLDLKINHCEAYYTHKKRPTIFKMTDEVYPSDLDTILENKGYHKEAETFVYTASIVGQGEPSDKVRITHKLSDDWIKDFARLNNISATNTATLKHMLALISTQCGYLRLMNGDDVIGVALGVVDDSWMGVFDVVVDTEHRGHGHGRTIMEALFNWGTAQGADNSYLQVQGDNTAASHLYRSLGYQHQYSYWYRVKDITH